MAYALAVFAQATYSPISTLTTTLDTMKSASGVTLLITGGFNAAEREASAWAVRNGVPFLAVDDQLEAAGCTPQLKPVYTNTISVPNGVLLAGTSARIIAASGFYISKGTTVTAI